ncbi:MULTISPECIES: 2-hydroxyacid dehydrogenase [unclassified Streptomyces]|uniref:2-hydroxyacid dehydrogenase n=1 Tax=unclassified Streptomyces TaxID=2593676 RepID=UPI0001C18A73|nr:MULTISPECIES: 2-hydroxyacid dehydrogenase [unclassified Streptomyces]MYR64528.1 2-hydroxyacid dehydrogenase [Streptomyces sp. SID4939]MYR99530.1 2-hydroxyacid dehydrogenase [Streptomyces sp. SID4940]MYT64674.1 2-hydroxyacid dehydrogenase [Streptomyces sp. SID8357]MYT87780.1 2-hydroxyacid dehydrogenase [Streptomyces sp. SID8360]MYW36950.1 2-hydroxyacid dehydrogenase [Streptomyces sp. SID1]MYX70958.1 2-hydroxyacid dehydrogenase [Streptomyces sp. SID3915]
MEILAFGVQSDEKPLIEKAFEGRHEVRCLDVFLTEDTAPIAQGYEIVSTSVNADLGGPVLRALAAGGTRMIAQRSTGFNNIDLGVAERLGLRVARVSHYSPQSVAEFAWTLAMAVNRRIVRAVSRTRDFDFRLDGLLGRDLHGRTAGVLGTGKIGEAFARIAHGFGMELLGWDVTENPACTALGMTYVDKERLFAESDLISLHVPLLPATQHLVDATALAAMKDDAILVNSSRGGLVDTTALVAELRRGRFSGVGLDVYEAEAGLFYVDKSIEGIDDDTLARLITFPNVIVTSHQAYYTREAVGQIIDATVRNVTDYLAGTRSENVLVPAV